MRTVLSAENQNAGLYLTIMWVSVLRWAVVVELEEGKLRLSGLAEGGSQLVLAHLTLGQLKSPVPCHLQIMLLETARRYNHETECITFLKDFTYSKDDFHRAGLWKTLAWAWAFCPMDLQVRSCLAGPDAQGRLCRQLAFWQEIGKKHPLLRLSRGSLSWGAQLAICLIMGQGHCHCQPV